MSLLIWMIEQNLPLYKWRDYVNQEGFGVRYSGWMSKKIDQVARLITNSCANSEVVDLVAQEWDLLPPLIRISLTNEMNEALGTRSNNKTKGIRRLDELLNGRVLRKEDISQTERKLKTIGGKLISVDRKLNPAVTGATMAHASYALPPNYDSLSPSEKRKLREELARHRREGK